MHRPRRRGRLRHLVVARHVDSNPIPSFVQRLDRCVYQATKVQVRERIGSAAATTARDRRPAGRNIPHVPAALPFLRRDLGTPRHPVGRAVRPCFRLVHLGAAMRRSWELVRGRWWRTFLVLLLMLIVWYVARLALDAFLQLGQFLLAIVLSPFIIAGVTLASAELVSALVSPVLQILIVLIYFDLRVRREALDLFQMAYRLAAPATSS